jgi:hypothetical protein
MTVELGHSLLSAGLSAKNRARRDEPGGPGEVFGQQRTPSLMKSKKTPPLRPATRKPLPPLKFTPAEGDREAAKLREFRDDLEAPQSERDTSIRSSPLGRDD